MNSPESAQPPGPSPRPAAATLEFREATKRYPGQTEPAVDGLTLEVPAGEICVLVGPSGCGKTTAMRMVNRMIDITDGDILLDGSSVKARNPAELRRDIGYAIQQIGLFPHLSVASNIATVPRLLGWSKDAHPRARRRAARARQPRPARDPRPLPGPALGRPAPARRRGARAGGRPAADADGRAVRRDRPDQPRAAPERVPAAAARDPQDDRVRHPRHRRGDQDGRSDRDHAARRQARPVRVAGGAADVPRQPLRGGLRRRRPRAQAAGAPARARRRPVEGAAGPRRRAGRRGARQDGRQRGPLPAADRRRAAARWAGSRSAR